MAAASYRVIAPYVTLKVTDANGAAVVVGFYKDAVVSNADAESIQHHLDSGMVEKVKADDFNDGSSSSKSSK